MTEQLKKFTVTTFMVLLMVALILIVTATTYIGGSRGSSFDGQVNFTNNIKLDGNLTVKGGSPWVDVKAFGAKGDNVTDDWLSIQNAINYTYFHGGGIVFFPIGVYKITKPILLSDDDQISSDNKIKVAPITLQGAGSSKQTTTSGTYLGSVIYRQTNGDIIRINLNNALVGYTHVALGITIKDLSLVGDATKNITCVRGYWVEENVFERLTLKDCIVGFNFSNAGTMPGGKDYPQMTTIQDVRISYISQNNKKGIAAIDIYNGETIHIDRISSNGNFTYGIKMFGTIDSNIDSATLNHMNTTIQCSYCNGIRISGMHSEDITKYFARIVSSRGMLFQGFTLNAREPVNVTAFRIEGGKEISIKNGYIRFSQTGGYDLHTFDPAKSIEMQGIQFQDGSQNYRVMRQSTVGSAWGYVATDSTNLGNQIPFLRLSTNTTTLFRVNHLGVTYLSSNLTAFSLGANLSSGVAPTAPLDINSDKMRIRKSGCMGNSCNQGDMCWNATKICVCVATNSRKCATLS